MNNRIAKTHQVLSKPHIPPARLLREAGRIAKIENFFVGLPDVFVPLPQNVLIFSSGLKEILASPRGTSHSRHLLVFNMEGAATVLLDGAMLRLEPGQALLVLPFQAHRYLPDGAERFTWVYVSFESPEAEGLREMRDRSVDVPADLWPFFDCLVERYRLARSSREVSGEVAALLSYLLLRLLRECRHTVATPWDSRQALAAHRIVHRASHLITTHMTECLSVSQIAKTLAVSAGHLRTCFRRVLGISVSHHIRNTRIHAACALISRTELNITEIGERCGFESVFTFSRVFKRVIGSSPTAYRAHLWEHRNLRQQRSREPLPTGTRRRPSRTE